MLLPINKILCPTDFSEASITALKQAIELCDHFGATLCLVHVVPSISRLTSSVPLDVNRETCELDLSEYEDNLHRCAQKLLREMINDYMPTGMKFCTIVAEGDAATEIMRTAEDEQASLIVLAAHGMTGWRNIEFGSVAERVVRRSSLPVLIIHTPRESAITAGKEHSTNEEQEVEAVA